MQNELVSVLIPAFNAEKYIEETIQSILKQAYPEIEIIVVDDGSTDDTVNILKGIDDKRLQIFSQENKGASTARNTAYNLCKGAFIKFMDADDLLNSECVAEQVMALSGKTNCIASAKWGRFKNEDLSDFTFSQEPVWKNMDGKKWAVESLIDYGRNMTQPGIFLIPRPLIEQEGLWDESLSLIDDFEFMMRIITGSKEVIFCENSILYYRSGMQQSLSRQFSPKHKKSAYDSLLKGIDTLLQRYNNERSRLAAANSMQLLVFGLYPRDKQYFLPLENIIKELGGSSIKIEGGNLYKLLGRVVGWKMAKRLRLFLYKNS